jgi:dihydroorotate dehydrogenase (NAD+) catalytic subunit
MPFWRRNSLTTRETRRHSVETVVRIGDLELPNPIVVASGTFGYGDEVARLCDPAPLGAITAKSLAPFAWDGNPAPRLHATTGGMLNSVGLQGPGIEHWIDHDLPRLRARGARVIASLWGRTVDDFGTGAKMLGRAAGSLTAVEINVSCPNLHHDAELFAHSPEQTGRAVAAVVDADLPLPVLAKLAPDVTAIVPIAGAALDAGATGLTLVNTVRGLLVDADARTPRLGAGRGGLSGPAIKPIALRVVQEVATAYPGVPIVGTGGVTRGVDAVEMLLAGATAVGVGTAIFDNPRAPQHVLDELVEWCARRGVDRVADLIGAVH